MNTPTSLYQASEGRRRLTAALELLNVNSSLPAEPRKALLESIASLARCQDDTRLLSAAMSELHMLKFEGASRDEKIRGTPPELGYPEDGAVPYGP